MKKLFYSLAALLFIAAGCTNDDLAIDNQVGPVVVKQNKTITSINATIGGADTRVQLVNGDEVVWSEDDRIGLFSVNEDDGWRGIWDYRIASGVGTSSAVFTGDEIEGSTFYAVYPYNISDWRMEEKLLILNWGWQAIWGEEGIDWYHEIPMLAKSDNNNMQFKQLAGILHFAFKGKSKLAKVLLTGNNGEQFYSLVSVDYSTDEPIATPFEESRWTPEIGTWPGYAENEMVQLSEDEPVDVYFALPAGMTFKKGLTIRAYMIDEETDTEGNIVNSQLISVLKSTDKTITVERGVVTDFAAFDLNEQAEAEYKKQYDALMAFHKAMGSPEWEGWGTDRPFNEWMGVLSDGSTVDGISINDENVSGSIPAELADLPLKVLELNNVKLTSLAGLEKITSLEQLALRNNGLSGNLPEEVAALTNLHWLWLTGNDFENSIPESWLNSLENVDNVDLSGNKLSGTITLDQQQLPFIKKALDYGFDRSWIYNQQEGYGLTFEGMITDIRFENPEKVLKIGEEFQISPIITPESNADYAVYEIEHNPDNAIEMNESGYVKALAAGDAVVVVKSADERVGAVLHVRVIDPLIGEDGVIDGTKLPYGSCNYWGSLDSNNYNWQFILDGKNGNMVSFLVKADAFDSEDAAIPTGTFAFDVYVDTMEGKGYDGLGNSTGLTIGMNEDGAYEISFSGIEITGRDGETINASFSWVGSLTKPSVVSEGE